MTSAMLILVGCQLLGELLRATFQLPIPGPVIGMFLLALALGLRARRTGNDRTPAPLKPAAEGLIANMGLLFVPAGVGIIAEAGVIRKEWLPILVAVAGSTILSLIVTALVMHWTLRPTHTHDTNGEGRTS
ncbi:CidA/LrgA family protein [Gluconacetobacter asukensis]|uniref:CidA/LrgA family protein n=3 Tax=Gluconacetobacter asukensis TaxID=1017181 RepID=A0A7W4IZ80_9PROT|nr:CidA/LrgA family protein [Gluconacetobacter asukensis]